MQQEHASHLEHHTHSNHVIASTEWYGWQAWDWKSLVIAILMIWAYVVLERRMGRASNKQRFYFASGIFTFLVAMFSPMAYLGHHGMFSVHMFQQSLNYMVFPALLIIGIPVPWFERWMQHAFIDRFFRLMTKPLFTILGFNVLFSLYHIPYLFDLAMRTPWLEVTYHLLLQLTAFQMWWSMLTPIQDQNEMSDLKKLAYIYGNGVILTPACALIVFANDVLYNTYINVDPSLAWISGLSDQQAGGVIMKIVQEMAYGITLASGFFAWYRKEKEKDLEELMQTPEPLNGGGRA